MRNATLLDSKIGRFFVSHMHSDMRHFEILRIFAMVVQKYHLGKGNEVLSSRG